MGCAMAKGTSVTRFSAGEGQTYSFHDAYTLGDLLGAGTYGTVFKATRICSGEDLAVKVVDGRGGAVDSIRGERAAWSEVEQHPNIVSLVDTFVEGQLAYFVMELCQSSLIDAWMAEPRLNEFIYAEYFAGMVAALQHLHSSGIVHRDVKHNNFLVGRSTARTVKLCDFGLACTLQEKQRLTREAGTPAYMAPEVLTPRASSGTASDVWSLGVIVYIAFFGRWPYAPRRSTTKTMVELVRSGETIPEFRPSRKFNQNAVSDVAVEFLRGMLIRDPNARSSAAACLRNDFLAKKDIRLAEADGFDARQISLRPILNSSLDCGAFATPTPQVNPQIARYILRQQDRARGRAARRRRRHRTYSMQEKRSCNERNSFDDVFSAKERNCDEIPDTEEGGFDNPFTANDEEDAFEAAQTSACQLRHNPVSGDEA